VVDLHDCGLCKDWTRMEFSMSCLGELMVLPKYFSDFELFATWSLTSVRAKLLWALKVRRHVSWASF
jgi:hypothetical protein